MDRKKILIVDDSQIVLRAFGSLVEAAGYEVILAQDGGTAVSTVRTQTPDLILLDITFPPDVGHGGGIPWDGFLIMDWLRRMGEGQGTPIIVITGDDSGKYRDRALAMGAAAFFQKPVDPNELIQTIQMVLGDPVTALAAPPAE